MTKQPIMNKKIIPILLGYPLICVIVAYIINHFIKCQKKEGFRVFGLGVSLPIILIILAVLFVVLLISLKWKWKA